MGGRIGFPLYSIYNSSKWAVEGFSEALQYELAPLNIKVKLIEPGVIKTDFYERSLDTTNNVGWRNPMAPSSNGVKNGIANTPCAGGLKRAW
jgi:short-subunit dehydrogenase